MYNGPTFGPCLAGGHHGVRQPVKKRLRRLLAATPAGPEVPKPASIIMAKGAQQRHRWVFYYDGDCGFCTRMATGLSRTDLLGRLTWTTYQSLEDPPRGLSWEGLDQAPAYLDTGRGRLHGGFHAFRMLTLRLLPLMPLAPILWLPGVDRVGTAVYRWIARNRYRISGCRAPGVKPSRRERPREQS